MKDRVGDPGFTPSIRVLSDLLDLFAASGEDEEVTVKAAERAVLRIEAQHAGRVAKEVASRAASAVRPARGRLTHLAGRLVQHGAQRDPDGSLLSWLLSALEDKDVKTRHVAARALGKVELTTTTAAASKTKKDKGAIAHALVQAFDRGSDEDKRALALALGKVGGDEARTRLLQLTTTSSSSSSSSPEQQEGEEGSSGSGSLASLAPTQLRAVAIVEREAMRDEDPGAIDVTKRLGRPVRVWFHTRSGLEDILKEELRDARRVHEGGVSFEGIRFVAPGIVEATFDGPLSHATSLIRTSTHVGFPLLSIEAKNKADLAEQIVNGLTTPEALDIFRAFTVSKTSRTTPPIRFRLTFTRGGHRRALVWRSAELLRAGRAASRHELINDPTESTWEVLVAETGADATSKVSAIELVPRAFDDDRFAYRRDLVAASSHPTIAVALARIAPRRDDDVVWDPFVGAGAELIERAMLGPYARLIGTDTDPRAVLAARSNMQHAHILSATAESATVTIAEADASTYKMASAPNVIITNPPMGRRVERGEHIDLLERFLTHAARVLAPGGAIVWMVPEPRRMIARAEKEGLSVDQAFAVDMGGFSAELTLLSKTGKKPAISKKTRFGEKRRPRKSAAR